MILMLSGKKQAGKTSAANYIAGRILLKENKIREFFINDNGDLVVNYVITNSDGEIQEGRGILDLTNRPIAECNYPYINYLEQNIWPYVKIYSFADELKSLAMSLYGLTAEQCYGTNDEKNTATEIKWKAFRLKLSKESQEICGDRWNEYMTGREFLQVFGTDICRDIDKYCWVRACLNKIEQEQVPLSIIADTRFPEEIQYVKRFDVRMKTIRFTRSEFKDKHPSETALDDYSFDYVIDNKKTTIEEKNEQIEQILRRNLHLLCS